MHSTTVLSSLNSSAVIGGGIGGASASYFLTQLFNGTAKIDLFEGKQVGGRAATVEIGGKLYEAGGSIIHPRNKYMKNFTELFNLTSQPHSNGKSKVWDGKKFLFEEGDSETATFFNLVARYGFELFRLTSDVSGVLNKFDQIYGLQNNGIGFENVTALLSAIDPEFPALLTVSMENYLNSSGYNEKFISELVKSIMAVNYGQDTDIHAFVGMVGMAGADSNLWSVKGGNNQVHFIIFFTISSSNIDAFLYKNDANVE